MKATFHARFGEIDVSGSADDYVSLAALVRLGSGALVAGPADPPDAEIDGQLALSLVRVSIVADQAVVIRADEAERSLLISGDLRRLAVLADNVASLAQDERGGHQHVEYFDGHAYLAEGSAPVILNSPRVGNAQQLNWTASPVTACRTTARRPSLPTAVPR